MARIKRFPEYIEIKIEDTDEGPLPKVTRITEIRDAISDYPYVYSDKDTCKYVREDIVQKMADSFIQIIARYVRTKVDGGGN